MSAVNLSELVGVTRAAISQYEHSLKMPRSDVMSRITQVLNLPHRFFSFPPRDRAERNFFRSLSSATKTARKRARHKNQWLRDIVEYLRAFIELPKTNIPDFETLSSPHDLKANDIETFAVETRKSWGLGDGPISNIAWLLENNGIIITYSPLDAETLDAFSDWPTSDTWPQVFLGSDKGIAARSRFDAAHELGHLVLHRRVPTRDVNNSTEHRLFEEQANRFAAAFLLPAASFGLQALVPGLDAFANLKPTWKCSIKAMIMRARSLDLISSDDLQRLMINYNRRRWRLKEPYDDAIPIERPRLLGRAIQLLIAERVVSKSQLLADLPYSSADIEQLCGLPDRYFDEADGALRIRPIGDRKSNDLEPNRQGTVIDLGSRDRSRDRA